MGSRLIETGRHRTCNISTEESYPLTEPRLGDWRGAPSRSSCWVTRRSSTTAAPRPPGGGPGASATTRRPRAPQAHTSLGRVVHHRQDFEAQNIQAGQQSRRGLQQRLEHPTATSLLPLRCFQVVHIPRSLYIRKKSPTVKEGSALPRQSPTLPRGLKRGEPPLRQNFPRKKSFCQNVFRAFRLLR
jgi:hypothetical protein